VLRGTQQPVEPLVQARRIEVRTLVLPEQERFLRRCGVLGLRLRAHSSILRGRTNLQGGALGPLDDRYHQ
jgi:hypothetical protein